MRDATNYQTAAQQTLTLPWGNMVSHSHRPPRPVLRPGTVSANSGLFSTQGSWDEMVDLNTQHIYLKLGVFIISFELYLYLSNCSWLKISVLPAVNCGQRNLFLENVWGFSLLKRLKIINTRNRNRAMKKERFSHIIQPSP